MADNTTLNTGTGGDVIASDDIGPGVKYQRVKVTLGADGVNDGDVASGNPMPVSGTVTANIAAGTNNIGDVDILTIAAGDNNIGNVDIVTVPAPLSTTGGGTEATALRVTIANDSTGVVSVDDNGGALTVDNGGTFAVQAAQSGSWSLAANQSVNVAQINGVATTMGNGISGTGVQRVTIASDSTGQVTLATGSNTIGALTANQSVNCAQMNGTAVTMGNGVSGTGVQRVTIASDSTGTVAATQSGTWTVQPGNTANTTAWLTSPRPATSGGNSYSHLVSAATTNATVVKASAGQVYGWSIFNTNASARYVKLHNTASTPTAGTGVVYTISVPATGGSNISLTHGIAFSTGIAFTTVTEAADSGTTAVAANDLIINIHYT